MIVWAYFLALVTTVILVCKLYLMIPYKPEHLVRENKLRKSMGLPLIGENGGKPAVNSEAYFKNYMPKI